MKKYQLRKGSTSLESLELIECDVPEPGEQQLLIRVHAASLNFRDQAIVTGNYFGGVLKGDTVPLSDGAGEVVAVGRNVTRFKTGDRVIGTFFQVWIDGVPDRSSFGALGSPFDGMLTEYIVLDEQGAVHCPAHLSYEEAATLPCAGVTAWNALNVSGTLRAGQTVLVLGTGGVSIFGLQFARMGGARVIVTSSNDGKIARAVKLGASASVNYAKTPEWHEEVLKLTEGRGVDHIIEVGGVGTLAKSFQCVGFRGQVTLIGVLAGREGDTNPHGLMMKNARLCGVFVGSRAMFEQMNEAIAVNRLQPVVDRVFPFADAADAYVYARDGKHFGKVVIRIE